MDMCAGWDNAVPEVRRGGTDLKLMTGRGGQDKGMRGKRPEVRGGGTRYANCLDRRELDEDGEGVLFTGRIASLNSRPASQVPGSTPVTTLGNDLRAAKWIQKEGPIPTPVVLVDRLYYSP